MIKRIRVQFINWIDMKTHNKKEVYQNWTEFYFIFVWCNAMWSDVLFSYKLSVDVWATLSCSKCYFTDTLFRLSVINLLRLYKRISKYWKNIYTYHMYVINVEGIAIGNDFQSQVYAILLIVCTWLWNTKIFQLNGCFYFNFVCVSCACYNS